MKENTLTNLAEVNLRDADLSGAYLTGADMRGANLRGADLSDTKWAFAPNPEHPETETHDQRD